MLAILSSGIYLGLWISKLYFFLLWDYGKCTLLRNGWTDTMYGSMSLKLKIFISSAFILISGLMSRVGRGMTGLKWLKWSIRIHNRALPTQGSLIYFYHCANNHCSAWKCSCIIVLTPLRLDLCEIYSIISPVYNSYVIFVICFSNFPRESNMNVDISQSIVIDYSVLLSIHFYPPTLLWFLLLGNSNVVSPFQIFHKCQIILTFGLMLFYLL